MTCAATQQQDVICDVLSSFFFFFFSSHVYLMHIKPVTYAKVSLARELNGKNALKISQMH